MKAGLLLVLQRWASHSWRPARRHSVPRWPSSIVAADVTDEQPTRGCVVIGAIGIAEPPRPDGVVVGSGAVVERVVGRHRAVGVESQDLARGLVRSCAGVPRKWSPVVR